MTQHREVVDRHDQRHGRSERRTEGRAVEHVDAVARSEQRQHHRVPAGVSGRRGRAARAAEAVPADGDVVPPVEQQARSSRM